MGIGLSIALGGLGRGIAQAGGQVAQARRDEQKRKKDEATIAAQATRQKSIDRRADIDDDLSWTQKGGTVGSLDPRYYNEDGTTKTGNGNDASPGALVGKSSASTQDSEHVGMRLAGTYNGKQYWARADGRTPTDVANERDREEARAERAADAKAAATQRQQFDASQQGMNRELRGSIAAMAAANRGPAQIVADSKKTRAEAAKGFQQAQSSATQGERSVHVPKPTEYGHDSVLGFINPSDSLAFTRDKTGADLQRHDYQRQAGMAAYARDSTNRAGQAEAKGIDPDTDPTLQVSEAKRRVAAARALYVRVLRESGDNRDAVQEAAQHLKAIKEETWNGLPANLKTSQLGISLGLQR